MSACVVVTGDDVSIPVTLKKNAATFAISNTAEVKACLVSVSREETYSTPVPCSKDAAGANWANSLVVVEIPSASTSDISYQGVAKLEIQVADPGKLTWFVDCEIVRGHIP